MWKIRIVKKGIKGKKYPLSVQVVDRRDQNHRTKIIRHIGTANNDLKLDELKALGQSFIDTEYSQIEIFEKDLNKLTIVSLDNLEIMGSSHTFAYEFLFLFYKLCGFNKLNNKYLKDLSIMRIIEPTSKLHTIELLKRYFEIDYDETEIYRSLIEINKLQKKIEKIAVNYAKENLSFNFTLVFYDVTTLYYESFKDDGFRKAGFSKDNKPMQPQIVIGLLVS